MSKKKPIFIKYFAKPLYKFFYLNPRVKIIKEDNGLLDKIKGPAIIVGNHSHALDSMFISAAIKPHVRWVAGAYLFKTKFVGYVVKNLATCIPKQQGRSDLTTIKTIKNTLNEGSIVGLFPEGTRTWDGNSYDMNHKATAKMLRIFKVPVYFVSLEGAYDLHPRWADEKRRGLLIIRLKKVLSIEDLKTIKLDELKKITKENLYFNHQLWQENANRPFVCNNRAHGIQRLLYVCPKCNSIQTIYGKKHKVYCSSCNTEDELSEQLFFEKKAFGFKTLANWNQFQQEFIKNNEINFKSDNGDFFKKGVDKHFEIISKNYKSIIFDDRIEFNLSNNDIMVFEFDKIESMILSVKQSIEFYFEGNLYSFRLQPDLNSLKYVQKWEAYNA